MEKLSYLKCDILRYKGIAKNGSQNDNKKVLVLLFFPFYYLVVRGGKNYGYQQKSNN